MAASIRHPNVISIYRGGRSRTISSSSRWTTSRAPTSRAIIAVRGRLDPNLAATLVSPGGWRPRRRPRARVRPSRRQARQRPDRDRQGDQRAYLTDFGLTKRTKSRVGADEDGGWSSGRPTTWLPSNSRAARSMRRVDVYALGCVLYEALTGHVPYPRDTDAATMWAHMSEDAPVSARGRSRRARGVRRRGAAARWPRTQTSASSPPKPWEWR